MVITNEAFDEALGEFLRKAGDDSIKNVLGTFDQEKTVPQNITQLKVNNGDDLKNTIAFLKANSPAYPVAQQVLSTKNRNKEAYSQDIAIFLDLVKPSQCMSCHENYIPAAELCSLNEPKCYLCKCPSHGECYKDAVIQPEVGIIFVCTECLSVKVAKDLAVKLNTIEVKCDEAKDPIKTTVPQKPDTEEAVSNHDKEDCPLYLKRQCPHGLTGKREIEGNPCPYKHRRRCWYWLEYGPTGCRFGKKCSFLHPEYCKNSLNLKACLNRSCQYLHMKGTQRNARNLPQNPQLTIPTSNRFPNWMADESQANASSNSQSNTKPERLHVWKNNLHNPTEKQQPPKTNLNNSRDFLERQLQEMKSDLMTFIRTSITQAASSTQPQYVMIQPSNISQQSQTQTAPVENWTNHVVNAQIGPQMEHPQMGAHQVPSYQQQILQQAPPMGAR